MVIAKALIDLKVQLNIESQPYKILEISQILTIDHPKGKCNQ
uniref:Uncharacterized protein n=1 Tax=Rhizophora mucronata TaxID=61149 RepID=A0A2P2Q986_RHIMU